VYLPCQSFHSVSCSNRRFSENTLAKTGRSVVRDQLDAVRKRTRQTARFALYTLRAPRIINSAD
jgi:hypothetical protein